MLRLGPGYRWRPLPRWIPPTPALIQQREEARARARIEAERTRPPRTISHDRIPVSLSDRWYILGMTGSGKTTFAQRLFAALRGLYPYAHLYALDSKGGDDFAGWPGLVTTDAPPAPLPPAREGVGGVQVWQPPMDDPDAYNAWLEAILKARHPAVVYIDELSSLASSQSGTAYPLALAKLQKQGRSLGICVITLTQEAAYIPRQIAKQATHFVYFRLQNDRHGVAQATDLLGFERPREPEAEYGFFYRRLNPRPGPAVEYSGHQEFFAD